MNIKAVFFDLDGTLLPMDQDKFVKYYFGELIKRFSQYGYDGQKLEKAMWAGILAMVKNNGSENNELVFRKTFENIFGNESLRAFELFDSYYRDDFDKVSVSCGYNPESKKTVDLLKDMGYRLVLATNPVFPAVATEKRIKWAGLSPDDFELITTYENSHYCKPTPDYYKEILGKTGLCAKECIMVGNDTGDDMPAEKTGMNVFLLTDCLINRSGEDISVYPNGGFSELIEYTRSLG
ncbi:MAG: HAD family hydrolase [Eubacteriales bacterium]